MSNIERIQKEGERILFSSGWDSQKIDALIRCLIDFTSQAPSDKMYKDAKVELYEDKNEQTLDIIWKTNRLKVRVNLYDEIAAHWDLCAGEIINGVEVEIESSGAGGNCKFFEYGGCICKNENWALHFYWWLEDYITPTN